MERVARYCVSSRGHIELVTPFQESWVTSERDPDWRFTDKAGHVHTYGPNFTLPTLLWHKVPRRDEDGEEYDAGYYRCLECGQEVTPGTRAPLWPHIHWGLPFIRGEWLVAAVLVRESPMLMPGEYDAGAFFGDDMLRGTVGVLESRTSHQPGKPAECVARFVSKGPITPGKACPAVLRGLLKEAVPQAV